MDHYAWLWGSSSSRVLQAMRQEASPSAGIKNFLVLSHSASIRNIRRSQLQRLKDLLPNDGFGVLHCQVWKLIAPLVNLNTSIPLLHHKKDLCFTVRTRSLFGLSLAISVTHIILNSKSFTQSCCCAAKHSFAVHVFVKRIRINPCKSFSDKKLCVPTLACQNSTIWKIVAPSFEWQVETVPDKFEHGGRSMSVRSTNALEETGLLWLAHCKSYYSSPYNLPQEPARCVDI